MDGSLEAGSSMPAPPPPPPPPPSGPLRTRSDTADSQSRIFAQARSELSRGNSNENSSSLLIPPNTSTIGSQNTDEEETWQDFLRRRPPSDIAERAADDPMRQAYLKQRRAQAVDEARRRRRAVSNTVHHGPPPTAARPHAASASSVGNRISFPVSLGRQAMDLSLERPLPRLPSFDGTADSPGGEYVVPRWQPDTQISECPICGKGFGLFYRRHHCRKCGRVVCASCSPHRITIPRQFIVHPPEDQELSTGLRQVGVEIVDLTGEEEQSTHPRQDSQANPALGGGQEVRLCNPCVPDPNPLPPPPYASSGRRERPQSWQPSSRDHSTFQSPGVDFRGTLRYSSTYSALGANANAGSSRPLTSHQHSHSSSNPHPPTSGLRTPYGSAPTSSYNGEFTARGYAQGWLPPVPASTRPGHRSRASTSLLSAPRHQARPIDTPLPPTPPPPTPPIREEDECPVCHGELPPKDADGSETSRETHITQCIESRFSSSAPRSASILAGTRGSGSASASDPGEGSSASTPNTNPSLSAIASTQKMPRRRTTGMVVYHASEKDCIGEDGGQQECVICFEEFAVGNEMGRLECLCKFHKFCIKQWWDTKGVGACPVHQGGI